LCFLVLLCLSLSVGRTSSCIIVLHCHFVSNCCELSSFLIILFLPLSMVGACFVSLRSWFRFGLIMFFVAFFGRGAGVLWLLLFS
jgi:hypothetical protein